MISELKFFTELNYMINTNDSFIVYKKPSHNKITCLHGEVFRGKIDDMSKKRGFIFMPFDTKQDGYLLIPKRTIETEFHLQLNKNQKKKALKNKFLSKKSAHVNSVKKVIQKIIISFQKFLMRIRLKI